MHALTQQESSTISIRIATLAYHTDYLAQRAKESLGSKMFGARIISKIIIRMPHTAPSSTSKVS